MFLWPAPSPPTLACILQSEISNSGFGFVKEVVIKPPSRCLNAYEKTEGAREWVPAASPPTPIRAAPTSRSQAQAGASHAHRTLLSGLIDLLSPFYHLPLKSKAPVS